MTGLDKQLANISRFFDKNVGKQFLPDRCAIYGPEQVSDGVSGHKLDEVALVSDVPCAIEASGKSRDVEAEGVSATNTCTLYLRLTPADALLLTETSKIIVAARGFNSELVFEQPLKNKDSFEQIVIVTAILTAGVRRPGSR